MRFMFSTLLGITYHRVGSFFLAISEIIFGTWLAYTSYLNLIAVTITPYYQNEVYLILGSYLFILGAKSLYDFLERGSTPLDISHILIWTFLFLISLFWGFSPAFLVMSVFSYLWYIVSTEVT